MDGTSTKQCMGQKINLFPDSYHGVRKESCMGFIFRVERKVGKILIHIKCIKTYCNVRICWFPIVTLYYISYDGEW